MDSSVSSDELSVSEENGPPKNKRGKMVPTDDRMRIVNMYKAILKKDPNMPMKQINQCISKSMGVGVSTIHKIINSYKTTNSVFLPKQKRAVKETFRDSFDELSRIAIRMHVRSIWSSREIPTIKKIHEAVSGDKNLPLISLKNLYRLLKDFGFRKNKLSRSEALTEKGKIVLWRCKYLENINKYRDEGRNIYYLDETLVNAGVCGSAVVFHISSEKDGFVPGGLLCSELKKKPRDCRGEISAEEFRKWIESILPILPENSIIVMDNAPYHSVKIDKAPTSESKKDDIIKWLVDKGEIIDRPQIYPILMQMVKRLKPLHKKYVIDELVKANKKTILRLPRNHHELNPMVLAWTSVKNHISMKAGSCELSDIKNLIIEGIDHVNTEMWKDFISRTMEEEKRCRAVDFIVDDLMEEDMDEKVKVTGDTSSSDYDTDSS